MRAKPRQAQHLDPAPDQDDTQIVAAVSRALTLLEAFTREDLSLGNAELAERTGLSKSTVSRMTYTLALHNFLAFDPRTREYRLGAGAVRLGAVAFAATNVRSTALPLMQQLARGSHFNIGLGTREDLRMIYTDTAEGDALVALRLFPGSRIPIATSAMGRAYLAAAAPAEREDVLDRLRSRHGEEWGRIRAGVEEAMEQLRTAGFCSSIGDWQKDINGVAVPIAPVPGSPLYVLNLGGPAYALSEAHIRERLAPRLVEIARSVEAALGALPTPRE